MDIVLKRLNEKIQKKWVTKIKKNIFENTIKFNKKFDVKIIYKNVDFINCKIFERNNNLLNIENNINLIYPYNDLISKNIDLKFLYNSLLLFNKFVLVFSWFAFSNQKKIYNIYDFSKNKIWQLVLKNEIKIKSNNNVIDSLELSWLFFKCYEDYFLNFLDYFWISFEKQNVLRRLDYCIDIQWIEVFQILDYLRDNQRKSKNVNSIVWTDKKLFFENNLDFKYWKKEVYKNFFSEHNDLKIYDKILDILENYFNRKVDWKNPYKDYLNSEFPIVRIELKKKKFKNLTNSSINWVFNNIECLFFDYLLRYFFIDLSVYSWIDKSLNWKKIFLAKEIKSQKLYHSLQMFLSYWEKIKEMLWENDFYKIIYKNWPKLENINFLDLLDDFEQWELLNDLFPKKD